MTLPERVETHEVETHEVETRLDQIEWITKNPMVAFMRGDVASMEDGVLAIAMRFPQYTRDVLLPSWRERWERHRPGRGVGGWECVCKAWSQCPEQAAILREIGVPVDGEPT